LKLAGIDPPTAHSPKTPSTATYSTQASKTSWRRIANFGQDSLSNQSRIGADEGMYEEIADRRFRLQWGRGMMAIKPSQRVRRSTYHQGPSVSFQHLMKPDQASISVDSQQNLSTGSSCCETKPTHRLFGSGSFRRDHGHILHLRVQSSTPRHEQIFRFFWSTPVFIFNE